MQIEFRKAARMDDVLIEARVQVAFVSGGRARRIPEALRSAMQADQKPAS
jgi:acyl-CoA thioester hydrolase